MNFRKLSPVQKKWALTSALLMVLGFNLSAPIKRSATSGSIELAATALPTQEEIDEMKEKLASMEEAVKKADGKKSSPAASNSKKVEVRLGTGKKVEVTLTKAGRNRTTVSLPEGTIQDCDKASDCDKLTVPHSIESMSDIADFIFENTGKVVEKDDDKKDETRSSRRRGGSVASDEKKEDDLKILEERVTTDRCERKEKATEKSKCLTENFVRVLRDKSLNIDREVAFEFFKSNLRGPLKEALLKQSPSDMIAAAKPPLSINDALKGNEQIQKMLGSNGLPSKYNDIRDSLAKLNAEVLHQYAAVAVKNQKAASNLRDQANDLEIRAQLADRRGLRQEAREAREQANELKEKYQEVAANAKTGLELVTQIIQPSLMNNTVTGLQSALDAQLLEKSSLETMLESLRAETKMLQKQITLLSNPEQQPTQSPVDPSGRIDVTKANQKGSEFGGAIFGSGGPARPGAAPGQQVPSFRGSQGGSIRGN